MAAIILFAANKFHNFWKSLVILNNLNNYFLINVPRMNIFTDRVRSTRGGNIFSLSVCPHPGGGTYLPDGGGGGYLLSGLDGGGVPTFQVQGGVPTFWLVGGGGTYFQVWVGGGYLLSDLDGGVPT